MKDIDSSPKAPTGVAKINDEVFVATTALVTFGEQHVAFLKRQALVTTRCRARICAHRGPGDAVHEMLIAIAESSYIRPHRHIGKSESFHIIEGVVDIVIFSDTGDITGVVELGDVSSGRAFYYRLAESRFHTLVLRTPMLIVHEVTNGPLVREETVLASFAPSEEQGVEVERYQAHVRTIADRFCAQLSRT